MNENFKAGDQVIIFFACSGDDSNPLIGYVADKQSNQADYIHVNTDLQQALAGYGVLINVSRIHAYSEETWSHLQEIRDIEIKVLQFCKEARNAIRYGKTVTFVGSVSLLIDEQKSPEFATQHQDTHS